MTSKADTSIRDLSLVFLAAMGAWVVSLGSPFWLDDFLQMEWARSALADPRAILAGFRFDASDVSPLWLAREDWSVAYARPLVNFLFAFEWWLWGDWAPGYHVTNLLLHGAASVLVAILADRLKPGAGLVAGLLFALHPSHQDSVAWISGRTDLVAALPFLAALLAHLRWRRDPSASAWLAPAMLALAFCAKETAAAFPIVVVGLELLDRRPAGAVRRDWGRIVGPSLLVVLVYVGLRVATGGVGAPVSAYFLSPLSPEFATVALRRVGLYLSNAVLLVPIDPVVSGPALAAHPGVVALISVALALGTYGIWRRSPKALLTGLLLFLAPLLPALPIVESQRFLYLPSVGVALALGIAWVSAPRSRRDRTFGVCVLVLLWAACLTKSFFRNSLITESAAPFTSLELSGVGPDARLYFTDVPPLVCMGFGAAVRYASGRDDVTVTALTLSTDLPEPVRRLVADVSADARTLMERTAGGGLRLSREGGLWFRTYMENFFLWGQELPLPGQRTRRDSLVGILLDDGVSKIEFYEDAGWTGTGVGLYQWTRAGIQRVDVASLPVATSERASESLTGDHAE